MNIWWHKISSLSSNRKNSFLKLKDVCAKRSILEQSNYVKPILLFYFNYPNFMKSNLIHFIEPFGQIWRLENQRKNRLSPLRRGSVSRKWVSWLRRSCDCWDRNISASMALTGATASLTLLAIILTTGMPLHLYHLYGCFTCWRRWL